MRVGKAVPRPRDLPQLLDCRGIQRELDVKRATAEAIMRQLPKVVVPDVGDRRGREHQRATGRDGER